MSLDAVGTILNNLFQKKPVWVTMLVVFCVSWFGAPIGFMLVSVNYAVPAIQETLREQEERHIKERGFDKDSYQMQMLLVQKNQTDQMTLVAESFEKALDRQEKSSDKAIEILERLTSKVEKLNDNK